MGAEVSFSIISGAVGFLRRRIERFMVDDRGDGREGRLNEWGKLEFFVSRRGKKVCSLGEDT